MKILLPLVALAVVVLCGCGPQTPDTQPIGSKGGKVPQVGGAPPSSAVSK